MKLMFACHNQIPRTGFAVLPRRHTKGRVEVIMPVQSGMPNHRMSSLEQRENRATSVKLV